MATNSVYSGDQAEVSVTGPVTAGRIVVFGDRSGIAAKSVASGDTETIIVHTKGVFSDLPKDTNVEFANGAAVYLDASNECSTLAGGGSFYVGTADGDYITADSTMAVCLDSAPVNYNVGPSSRAGSGTITAGTSGAIADPRIKSGSNILVTMTSATTKSGHTLVTITPNVGFTITVIKDTDATTETSAAGTFNYRVFY